MKVLRFFQNLLSNLIFFPFGYFFTAVFTLFALFFALIGFSKAATFALKCWAFSLFLFAFKRVRFEGLEHLNKNMPYIFAVNHASLFDIPALMLLRPDVSWIGRKKMAELPIFGRMLLKTGYLPIDPTQPKSALETLNAAVNSQHLGRSIAIFPEGTRTLTGDLGKFKRGIVYLIRNTKLDVIPLTLCGFYSFKPKNRAFIRHGAPLKIKIHPALKNSELSDRTDSEILSALKENIQEGYYA